jgi:acyl carrier protein
VRKVTVREIVYEQVRSIAEQQRKSLPPLTDDLRMLESGLDSLCVAILIATLDDELLVSPFDSDTVETPVTFGDLIRIYEHAKANA